MQITTMCTNIKSIKWYPNGQSRTCYQECGCHLNPSSLLSMYKLLWIMHPIMVLQSSLW